MKTSKSTTRNASVQQHSKCLTSDALAQAFGFAENMRRLFKMTPRELHERVKYLTRLYHPEWPEPVMVCSWRFTRDLPGGRYEFKCNQCGSVQVREELVGGGKQVCRA